MAPTADELLDALLLAGLEVTEIDGWRTRGSATFNPKGSVNHHTAGPRQGVAPSLGTCINGRDGENPVPGPLCNVHGPREESRRVNLVAARRANHAGKGGWKGLVGNSSCYGLEEEHTGYPDEPLSPLRYDRIVRVHAAFAYAGDYSVEFVCQHWEWTTRKIDFVKAHIDPHKFRREVAARLAIMRGAQPPSEEDIFMAITEERFKALEERIAEIDVKTDALVEEVVATIKDGKTRSDREADLITKIAKALDIKV